MFDLACELRVDIHEILSVSRLLSTGMVHVSLSCNNTKYEYVIFALCTITIYYYWFKSYISFR
jgi:hypothetical protein